MEHAVHSSRGGVVDHRGGVVFGITRVNHERETQSLSKPDLRPESGSLGVARRVVIVIVEPALADGDCARAGKLLEPRDVATGVKTGRVVGMNARGEENESGVGLRDSRSCGGRTERLADADDPARARFAGASDYRVAVAVEGRVREVGVAVDEDCLPSGRRGHFRSIHSRMGAAT